MWSVLSWEREQSKNILTGEEEPDGIPELGIVTQRVALCSMQDMGLGLQKYMRGIHASPHLPWVPVS